MVLFLSLMLIGSFMVILSSNPVDSVLFLVFVFLNAAGCLISFQIDFLALIFIIIYVGAIAVLFLFIVMMLEIKNLNRNSGFFRYAPFFLLYVLIFLFETYVSFSQSFSGNFASNSLSWINFIDNLDDIDIIGQVLFKDYYLCVLLAGILLLIALIGSIILTVDTKSKVSSELVTKQISRSYSFISFKK